MSVAEEPINFNYHLSVPLPREAAIKVAQRARAKLVMPEAWKPIPTPQGLRWHGAVHGTDPHMARWPGGQPREPKRGFRIVTVGDSITYGYGIEERFSWPRLLEGALRQGRDVEVVNIAAPGFQSSDIVGLVRRAVGELEADLILYGVCLNDFLPSMEPIIEDDRYRLPRAWVTDSKLAAFIELHYEAALRNFGLRRTLYSDIARRLPLLEPHFAEDVAAMNGLARDAHLPSIIAMVLDMRPLVPSAGYDLALIAAHDLERAGMTVIGPDLFFRRFSGMDFYISPWEGHPDERAHAIYASLFYDAIR